jgi:hypothetical protein
MGAKRYYFHASPLSVRERIIREGLRPGIVASYGPPAVYFFRTQLFAENYLSDRPMDVWRVDAKGLDVYPDPEDPTDAAYSEDAVAPQRLRYVGTFFDGEPLP